jgi:hypothetical protein
VTDERKALMICIALPPFPGGDLEKEEGSVD